MENIVNNILGHCSLDGQPEHTPAQFRRRVEKAVELIHAGKVYAGHREEPSLSFASGFVGSQRNNRVHSVTFRGRPPEWKCTCQDFRIRGGFDTQLVAGGYGRQCKHTLAQMIAQCASVNLPTYHGVDFWQAMTEQDAERVCDPNYQQALLVGGDAVLLYFVEDVLTRYGAQIMHRAADLLNIGDCQGRDVMTEAIRSANASTVFRMFEIVEIDGETYADFWHPLHEGVNNGQLPTIKSRIIDTITNI